MSIQRAPRPNAGYTLIRDEVLRDSRLSYRARGILAAILSRPDNWSTTAESLAEAGKEGRDAIRSAMKELEKAGYVQRQRVQDEQGHWSIVTVVFDQPTEQPAALPEALAPTISPETDFQAPVTENPSPAPENPAPGKPAAGFPGAIRTTDKNNRTTSSSAIGDRDDHPTDEVRDLCMHLADLIERNGSKRPTITKRWYRACRLMITVDHREPEKIRKAIDWCQGDAFWAANILSMEKLRERYDTLRLQAASSARGQGSTSRRQQETNELFARAEERARAREAGQPVQAAIA